MKDFVLEYVGNREVTFMMILDNTFFFIYGDIQLPYDDRRWALATELMTLLVELQENGVLELNSHNFYYKVT